MPRDVGTICLSMLVFVVLCQSSWKQYLDLYKAVPEACVEDFQL